MKFKLDILPSLAWYKLQLDFLAVEFEIVPDLAFYHDIHIIWNFHEARSIWWIQHQYVLSKSI